MSLDWSLTAVRFLDHDSSSRFRMDGGGVRGDGHLFQAGCPGRRLDPGIPTASNVDLTTAPFRASPDSTVRR